jgi:Double sensory domain of two-component sensor kinase
MTRTRFEVVSAPASVPAPPRVQRTGGAGVIATAVLLFAALGFAAWLADGQLRRLLSGLDDEALGQASRTLEEVVNREREQLVAEVKVLADDNRIRATVLAPKFDEATVQDVLDDLRKSSGASLLAVLDASGKVQAVSGAAGLRQVDLSASAAVKAAFQRPTSDIWTLPDQAQVIGLAPIRSGDQTPALLVKGLGLAQSQLATVETALGVSGAVLIGDRVAASSSQQPGLEEVFRSAGRLAEGSDELAVGDRLYRVKIGRVGEGATAARLVWLVPHHRSADRLRPLLLLVWCPVPLGALLLLLLLANSRRNNGGNA